MTPDRYAYVTWCGDDDGEPNAEGLVYWARCWETADLGHGASYEGAIACCMQIVEARLEHYDEGKVPHPPLAALPHKPTKEHVPESIAAEAAARIESMRAALRAALAVIEKPAKCHEVDTDPKYANCTGTPRYSAGLRIHHRECFELRAVILAALEGK